MKALNSRPLALAPLAAALLGAAALPAGSKAIKLLSGYYSITVISWSTFSRTRRVSFTTLSVSGANQGGWLCRPSLIMDQPAL